MGLLDKWRQFKENRRVKRIESNAKLVQKPKAMKEDRIAALEFFSEIEDPAVAVPALLKRFEYSLEHGINDTREKDRAMKGIVRHGDKCVPFIQTHMGTTTKIAWPIKILNAVADESTTVEILKSCLDFGDIAFDQAKVDKNYDVLCYLADYKVPGLAKQLKAFLDNHDERVRYAAIEVLKEQEDSEVPELLEPFLLDSTPENTRIRKAVIDAFANRGWKVKEKEKLSADFKVPNAALNSDGTIRLS